MPGLKDNAPRERNMSKMDSWTRPPGKLVKPTLSQSQACSAQVDIPAVSKPLMAAALQPQLSGPPFLCCVWTKSGHSPDE